MTRTVRPIITLLLAALAVAACGSDATPSGSPASADSTPSTGGTEPASTLKGDLTVFAAASLTDAFGEIGAAFMADNPDVTVTFNFAASSDLVTQINEGAPADVFASADKANMTKLTDAGSNAGEPSVFVRNTPGES